MSLTVPRVPQRRGILQLNIHSFLYVAAEVARDLLFSQNCTQLLFYPSRVSIDRVDVQSHFALNRYLLQQGQAQIDLRNSDLRGKDRLPVQTQKKEEKTENGVVRFDTDAGDEVYHLFVDFCSVYGSVDEGEGLEEGVD